MESSQTILDNIKYLRKGFKLKTNTIPKSFGKTKLSTVFSYGINDVLYDAITIGDVIYTLPSGMHEFMFFTPQYFIKYANKCLKQKTNNLYCKEVLITDKHVFIYRSIYSKYKWWAKPIIKTIPLNGTKISRLTKYFITKEDYYNFVKKVAMNTIQILQRDKSNNNNENIKIIKSFIKKFNL